MLDIFASSMDDVMDVNIDVKVIHCDDIGDVGIMG
jgi:hypothetical protein